MFQTPYTSQKINLWCFEIINWRLNCEILAILPIYLTVLKENNFLVSEL